MPRSLRLPTRLFLAFGAVVLMSALSAGLALLKLREIEHDMTQIVTVNNVKTALGHDMAEAVHIVARVVRSIALLQDESQLAAEVAKVDKARADYDRARAALEQFPPSERGKTLRAAIDAAATTTRAINNRAIELAAARRTAELIPLLLKESDPATSAWLTALDENGNWQAEESQADYERSQAAAAQARKLLIGASVMSALIAIGLTLLVVRSITRELGGEPSEVARLAQAIAAADMSTPIPVRPGDTSSVMACMARMQTALSTVVQAVRGNADSVATASAQIAQGNADLSHRTEEQASALQQTAATMDQLSATVRRNADNARQARQLALNASGVASHGGEVVGKVVHTMKGINDSSKKIADIISVIDSIAFQTNILALNAAVEAARAGEQGRGFAVVAGEVRTLAQRSADAARQIKTLIHDSVGRVEGGTSLVDDAGQAMQDIVASIRRVSDIVAEISAASTEQGTGVSQVGQAVGQMDQATQQNAALVEEGAATAESLEHQAHDLVQAVAVFKLSTGLQPALAPTA